MSLQYHILHSITGRLRLRIDNPRFFETLLGPFQALLLDQNGISEVRSNPNCRSIVVKYDAARITVEGISNLLDNLPLEEVLVYPARPRPRKVSTAEESPSWLSLTLSTASVAVGFLESAVAPWLLALASVSIFGRAFDALVRKGALTIDVLDAAATTVLTVQGQIPTAATMVWLVSLGDFIRDVTMQQSQRTIEGLLDANIPSAWVIRDGRKLQVQVEDVQEGEQVVIYPGELIPVDGTVVNGQATVDQKILTGESVPVLKRPGDPVYAATAVREGKLYVEMGKAGQETVAAKIVQLVHDAPVKDTRVQNYAERFANQLVPWSFLGAGLSYFLTTSVNTAASLLIVDYGTGIRVAAPTTVISAMTRAARAGIFIKGGRYLEQLAEVDTIVFDKTGTLTKGCPEVEQVLPYGNATAERVLALAASAEERLMHPVAEAIVRAAQRQGLRIPARGASDYSIGLGVEATVDGSVVHVGCERFMALKGVSAAKASGDMARMNSRAVSPVLVARDQELVGVIVASDPLCLEAPQVIQRLRELGIGEVVMLTGDNEAVAKRVADRLGIQCYLADVLPDQKVDYVKSLQAEGRKVAMIGDGINDSPALAQAHVGIAVRGGADVARETAGIALLEGTLWKLPEAIAIAREAVHLIQQNWKVIAYPNTAAIALALLGVVGPVGATLISNGSAILATLNALRPLFEYRDERMDR